MAVTATFNASTGLLSVIADFLNNAVTVSRNAAGNILVNGGGVARPARRPSPTRADPDRRPRSDDADRLDEPTACCPGRPLRRQGERHG